MTRNIDAKGRQALLLADYRTTSTLQPHLNHVKLGQGGGGGERRQLKYAVSCKSIINNRGRAHAVIDSKGRTTSTGAKRQKSFTAV